MEPITALATLGTSAYQFFQGEKQKKLARKIKPSNYVPPSVQEATANARTDANATMGPFTKRGLEKLQQASATTVENAKRVGGSPAQVQQAVADTDAREKELVKDLEVNDAAYRIDRKRDLSRSLQVEGQYERMSRDAYNAAKSALTGASMQNKYNAVSNLGEGVVHSYFDAQEAKLGAAAGGLSGTAARATEGANPASVTTRTGAGQDLYGDFMGRTRRMYGRSRFGINNPFDYGKFLADLRTKQFATGA